MPLKRDKRPNPPPPEAKSTRISIKIPAHWPVEAAEKRTGQSVHDLAREGVRRACFPEAP